MLQEENKNKFRVKWLSKKGQITIFVIIMFLLFIFFGVYNMFIDDSKEVCDKLCESNGMEYLDYKSRSYANNVCICSDHGVLKTFMM